MLPRPWLVAPRSSVKPSAAMTSATTTSMSVKPAARPPGSRLLRLHRDMSRQPIHAHRINLSAARDSHAPAAARAIWIEADASRLAGRHQILAGEERELQVGAQRFRRPLAPLV